MKLYLCSMFSLVVCLVILFGIAECSNSSTTPSPTTSQTNMSTASLMTTLLPSTTTSNMSTASLMTTHLASTTTSNMSTVLVTSSPIMSSANSSSMHMTTISSAFLFTSSIFSISSHLGNSSVHHSSIFTNISSTVHVMSSSAGNASIQNSTIHSTISPTPISNMSSTVIHNGSSASSHILPTMTSAPLPVTSAVPTSTVPPTTPTPTTPTPTTPTPTPGEFDVKNNGTVCLKMWGSLKFLISYKSNNGKELQTTVVLPSKGVVVDGLCEESLSSVHISWSHYSFEAYFHTALKGSNGHWNTVNVTIAAQTVNNTDFNNANESTIKESVTSQSQLEWLSGNLGRSLNCSVKKNLESKDKKVTISIEELRIKPFEVAGDKFGEADSCIPPTSKPATKAPKSNNTVAIAVGCSLAGLVLIVLIGYFIGKRRSRPGTGYRKL